MPSEYTRHFSYLCSGFAPDLGQGLGASKLFHFFLAQSELSDRRGSTRSILGLLEKSALVPEETAELGDGSVSIRTSRLRRCLFL